VELQIFFFKLGGIECLSPKINLFYFLSYYVDGFNIAKVE